MSTSTKLHKPRRDRTKAHVALWPPPIPGRCNFRKKGYHRCRRFPAVGSRWCKRHDTKSHAGEDNPNWKGGRSRAFMRAHLPQHLLERFDAIVNDPELTSVRELIALTGARLTQLLDKIPTRESRAAWAAIGTVLEALEQKAGALPPKHGEPILALAQIARSHVGHALHERAVWDEVHDAIERGRRLADTERRREESLQANLTAQQAIAMFNQLFRILAEEIPEPERRRAIAGRIYGLLQREGATLPASIRTTNEETPS